VVATCIGKAASILRNIAKIVVGYLEMIGLKTGNFDTKLIVGRCRSRIVICCYAYKVS